jgi:hypothetical protein
MMLAQPGQSVDILGETWNYANDNWGDTYGCSDYTREREPYVFFEQCFAIADASVNFDSQRERFLQDDFEELSPTNTFDDVGQISLLSKKLDDNGTKFVKFFELIGVDQYIMLVEMNVVTDVEPELQVIYEKEAAVTINYVLKSMLERSHLIARPAATPLAADQSAFYEDLAARLITDAEASKIYMATWIGEAEGSVDGTWESLGDRVGTDGDVSICRLFEDRTNVDVRWVEFRNCIFAADQFSFDELPDFYNQPGDLLLTSSHEYEGDFALYGYSDGHTFFDAFFRLGEYVYSIRVESRTLTGETAENLFNQTVDDFIYNVFMVNVNR